MSYSIVIPTKRHFDDIMPLLHDIAGQSWQASEVIIVLDRETTNKEEEQYSQQCSEVVGPLSLQLITSRNSDFSIGRGASYVRNRGIERVTADYVLGIDDDNRIATDFAEQIRATQAQFGDDVVMVPTEHYRETGQIRSQGYAGFYAWLGRARPSFLKKDQRSGKLMFCSSNCFRGSTKVLQDNMFPEHFGFVSEDFARSTAMTRSGVDLYVTGQVVVRHMMRDKNPLEESYLATTDYAFLKGRNRVRRVRSMGLSKRLCYFVSGLWIHTASLLYKILRYAPWSEKGALIAALLHGTRVGCTTKK